MANRDHTVGEGTRHDPTNTAAVPRKMRAITQDRYGSPDVLELREVPRPTPNEDQVSIRVAATSVNIADWHLTSGTPYMVRALTGVTKPKNPIPGADVAGVIEMVGSNVTRFRVGEEVFGEIGFGAFAEYALASESKITVKPSNVTFAQAAAAPLAGLTALQGLRDVGGIQAGQKVLINGASGGVGTFAVQLAKAFGAEVTAVCSTTKVDQTRAIGADHVIDYTQQNFVDTERGHHILFDNVGDRPWSETRTVLAPGGINVTITGPKRSWLGPFRSLLVRRLASTFGNKRMTWFTAEVKSEDLEFLADMLQRGIVVPVVEKTYPLEHLPQALSYLGEGHAHGKVVITV